MPMYVGRGMNSTYDDAITCKGYITRKDAWNFFYNSPFDREKRVGQIFIYSDCVFESEEDFMCLCTFMPGVQIINMKDPAWKALIKNPKS